MLETVLYAHEDWVAQVVWKPPTLNEEGKLVQPPCLLSISMDRTIIIWEPDVGPDGSGLWLDQVNRLSSREPAFSCLGRRFTFNQPTISSSRC